MSNDRNETNVYFEETSFLYGGNADYIEIMQAAGRMTLPRSRRNGRPSLPVSAMIRLR